MTEITLKVLSAELLLTAGADELFLHLDMPSTFPNMKLAATAQINVQQGHGEEWSKKNLGITPKITNIRINPLTKLCDESPLTST